MAYATVFSACIVCKKVFTYNPHKVPSIRVDGTREPVCESCIIRENTRRTLEGLELLPDPHPDAYKPIHESEL
jgi:hypothetical protein